MLSGISIVPGLIAFDSNVLIYALERNEQYSEQARQVFLRIEQDGGVCSVLVIAESIYGTITKKDDLTPLLSPSIRLAPVTSAIVEKAGKLRTDLGIKTADAIHIATALETGADHFITNDKALWNVNIAGLTIKGL